MAQEGRGIGLVEKLRAYRLQDQGLDTVEANVELGFRPDERDYGTAAHIVSSLGIRRVRLMTNNPEKVSTLEAFGVEVTDRVPLEVEPIDENIRYLSAKRDKLGHHLSFGNGKPPGGRRSIEVAQRAREATHGATHSR
jgi:3,4-dihydroxy 2-butanone 4-phosphate synthase/GTP cyclohydrolase II